MRAEGSVEYWLNKLLSVAQTSLHSIIRKAHHNIQDPTFNMLTFLNSFQAQVNEA